MICLFTQIENRAGYHERVHMAWHDAGEALNYVTCMWPLREGRFTCSVELSLCEGGDYCSVQIGIREGLYEHAVFNRIEGPYEPPQ